MLPITPLLPAICAALATHPTLLLTAPPGAGKTTAVPLALLALPWLAGQRILLLEPRRLAAHAAAQRLAEQWGEPLGQTIGLRTRLERIVSDRTRLEVLTEGVLTRQLLRDPALEGVGLVIFDEFHERSLEADLALTLCRDARATLELPLRLLLMSATLDSDRLASGLDAPLLQAEGRGYPVQEVYLPPRLDEPLIALTLRGIREALAATDGDVLVFLPGGYEIRATSERIAPDAQRAGFMLCPLFGDLAKAEQDRALRADPHGRRRVVLATNIAQTSLTIDGITAVVDSGLARVNRFDPNTGLSGLSTEAISQASATQRAGRAGRLAPGICYRLWSAEQHSRRAMHDTPEILHADLAPLALTLAAWGTRSPQALPWLDAPPDGAYQQAQMLLQSLGALDNAGAPTALGQHLAKVPAHPRLARLLLAAATHGQAELGARLAALLSERDLLRSNRQRPSDLELRLAHLERPDADTDSYARTQILRTSAQFQRLLPHRTATACPVSVGTLLAYAYPERIAQRRRGNVPSYLLAQGRAVRIPPHDPLAIQPWLVAARIDQSAQEGIIQLAAALDADELRQHHPQLYTQDDTLHWDAARQRVRALRSERLGVLTLSSQPWNPSPEQMRSALLTAIRAQPELLPWDNAARQWQARLMSLRIWLGASWPCVADATLLSQLASWLAPYLDGLSRGSELQRLPLQGLLAALLDYPTQQRFAQLAPPQLAVPSGSHLPLVYHPDGTPPILAVRLQELFGLQQTPTVAGGKVAVVLHLLSPAHQPIQVTQDLVSFWRNTYPEVKQALQRRYPRHYWPDDPLQAQATARPRPRPPR